MKICCICCIAFVALHLLQSHGSASRVQDILTSVMKNIAVNKSTEHVNLLVIEPVAQ